MQIEGSKIAAIAVEKLRVANSEAAGIHTYSGWEGNMKAVRENIASALELISLLAPDKPPAPQVMGAVTIVTDIDGFNDVSP